MGHDLKVQQETKIFTVIKYFPQKKKKKSIVERNYAL